MTDAPDLKAQFRLRPDPPRVTRPSRKVLIGLGGVAGIAIAGALFWALDAIRRDNQPPSELYNTENRTPADGLAGFRATTRISRSWGLRFRAISAGRSCVRRRKVSSS
jgi:hypothetical protein